MHKFILFLSTHLLSLFFFFFFNDTATTEIYTLSLHDALPIYQLLARATNGEVQEVILATNFTNEGEATAHYIAEMLRARDIKVSRIARGVPLGGELEYVDAGTISQALLDRRNI